jgi:REP-associated tyrosine transposase
MVRAGVVTHPAEWNFGGYNEIQKPRERYALIDYKRLMDLLQIPTINHLRSSHKKWVEEILKTKRYVKDSKWSQSIAVGSKRFVEDIKEKLGIRVKGRKIEGSRDLYHLREAQVAYNSNFNPENDVLRANNTYFWRDSP